MGQAMSPATVINPDGLPACSEFATGSCRGDGTTLKERLEALPTVGGVNVTAVSIDGETAGDDADVCGVEGVSFSSVSLRSPTNYSPLVIFRRIWAWRPAMLPRITSTPVTYAYAPVPKSTLIDDAFIPPRSPTRSRSHSIASRPTLGTFR